MKLNFVLPALLALIAAVAIVKKVDIAAAFIEGAKEGLSAMVRILPMLMLMLTAIKVFRASGGMDLLVWLISPAATAVGIPAEVIPIAVVKPFSGSGATALLDDIIKSCGVDGYVGRLAAVIASSTETTFYTLSVYVDGSVKKCGKVLFCAIAADVVSFVLAAVFTRIL